MLQNLPSDLPMYCEDLEGYEKHYKVRPGFQFQSKAKPKIAQPVAKSQTQLPKPKGPPKSKSKGKPKPKPKPESEPEPKPEPASEPDQPKKTIKLKLKSRLVAIDTEPELEFEANLDLGESDSQEDNVDEKFEQKTGGKGNDDDKLDMMELAFAVKHNGAHDIIQLAFAADFDVLHCKVSELLHVSPSNLQLAYKMPGMKKSDLRRHLQTHEHFEALKLEARKNIKGFVTEIEAANKKKGKVALGQQAKVGEVSKRRDQRLQTRPRKTRMQSMLGFVSTSKTESAISVGEGATSVVAVTTLR
ncbi:hypothetical protein CTheo_9101 [Ceratobasidium theobromae]|uniref:Uncharacterized protein n=1 Tax=Ceratobasidium theobromae TaxID=1582974 RepID=A0A5N5Q7P6_9AGAM|nr:hypothetical protein CTheo_9101 [Ceratobasidium theobromae]